MTQEERILKAKEFYNEHLLLKSQVKAANTKLLEVDTSLKSLNTSMSQFKSSNVVIK